MQRPIDPKELLEHQGWLRALAFELVGDSQRAEDVVQETWLVALQNRSHPVRNLQAWLGGVVRNRARQLRRGEERRRCLLYTSPSPRDLSTSRMPSSA